MNAGENLKTTLIIGLVIEMYPIGAIMLVLTPNGEVIKYA